MPGFPEYERKIERPRFVLNDSGGAAENHRAPLAARGPDVA